jgi:hypothetical protein
MRGRLHAVTAEMLTAELRKRLAKTNNTTGDAPAPAITEPSCRLGMRALRMAQVATALHMAQAATRTGETSAAPDWHDRSVES